MRSPDQAAFAEPVVRQASCYVLEFSVAHGGSRMADSHVHGDLEGLRASFDRRCARFGGPGCVDAYLVMWYGAVLHLWVVQHGVIVDGIDLHPYLRTGNGHLDRALSRLIEVQRHGMDDDGWSSLFDLISNAFAHDMSAALPLLSRVFDLRDRVTAGDAGAAAELARVTESLTGAVESGGTPAPPDEAPGVRLMLDWDAIATVAPALENPVLVSGATAVRWSQPCPDHLETHLRFARRLHLGVNDLEFGMDEFPDGGKVVLRQGWHWFKAPRTGGEDQRQRTENIGAAGLQDLC